MLSAKDLHGLCAMMPAFATDDAADIRVASTVDVGRLHHGVNKMITDGADCLTTTGSFGECYALLQDELRVLVNETVSAVKGRVPVVVGVPSENAREAVQKIKIAQEGGADGVIVGVPYYIPATVTNALHFFRDISELFPKMGILIYHNPALHRINLPIAAFKEIVKLPNVVGMKDSHRDALGFAELDKIVRGKISVFCGQWQYFDYAELGAAGFWSIDAWMGPWPLLALRDAVKRGDKAEALKISLDIAACNTTALVTDLQWRETAAKIAIEAAGYVRVGPLRAPFREIPQPVVQERYDAAAKWQTLCKKYQAQKAMAV